MRALLKNSKGAVTVLVTLLLVPAVLVSGTAVDLTRIYTARSIIQDANQMAANSVLSQYNALLHDLYGIFGVAGNDPVLAGLLDEYISVTVFGKDARDTGMGTLQLFYGSSLSLDEVYFADGKNLRNPDVLRRQIEEYMKFRGPVIIVKEFLELLGSSTFKEDAGVIEDKLEIDEAIAVMYEKYKELYDAITAADKCKWAVGGIGGWAGTVSSSLGRIRDEFISLGNCLYEMEEIKDLLEEEIVAENRDKLERKLEELEEEYGIILGYIEARTREGGGNAGGSSDVKGLIDTIESAVIGVDSHKPKFDKVVQIAKEIDAMRDELLAKVNALDARLKSGGCNGELNEALTKPNAGSSKSVMEMYRSILKWDNIEGMAAVYKDSGNDYIDGPVKDMLRTVIYRNKLNPSQASLSQEELKLASSLPELALSSSGDIVKELASYSEVGYDMPDGFYKFGEIPGRNSAFFKELSDMMKQPADPPVKLYDGQSEAGGKDAEEKQKNMIGELTGLVDTAYAGLTNDQLGAAYINSPPAGQSEAKASNISEFVSQAADNPVADVIADPYGSIARAGDYLLLLTYCTSIFSNYTTARPDTNGKARDSISGIEFPKSISGTALSPKVNYFFQSEWEYLYNGSEDAGANLSAVTRLIYLVRVICNYITVFSVSDVTYTVNLIRSAFALNPPLGLVLGELARAAFVAAESAVDLATLRAGHKVPLIKSGKSGQWKCSPKGLAGVLKNLATDVAGNSSKNDESKDEKGISYSGYLLFFLLSKGLISPNAAAELTNRTADLIEWNVINYKDNVFCDEEKMSGRLGAADRFKLEDMKTDFSITTTADMRMLFLTMPVANKFSASRGILMPKAMPVTVTDYRGY